MEQVEKKTRKAPKKKAEKEVPIPIVNPVPKKPLQKFPTCHVTKSNALVVSKEAETLLWESIRKR